MATSSSRMPDSDDESVDDDCTETGASTPLSASAADDVVAVYDSTLQSIADQINQIESEIVEAVQAKRLEWKNYKAPALKTLIEGTDNDISSLKERIERATKEGDAIAVALRSELEEIMDKQDVAKRSFYFPDHVHSFGSDGVFCGLDDFWLDEMSGHFDIELRPAMGSDTTKIILVLSGREGAAVGGAALRCRVSNFRLYSESVAVPTISYEDMCLSLAVEVVVVLSYQEDCQRWCCEDVDNDFEVAVKDFEGPFGLNKAVVTGIVAVSTPILRDHVLRHLSREVGSFVSQLPVPLQLKGSWQATGAPSLVALLGVPVFTSPSLCRAMGVSPNQMLTFVALQKSLGRLHASGTGVPAIMLSLQHLISYRRFFGGGEETEGGGCAAAREKWDTLKSLWEDAAMVFFSLTKGCSGSRAMTPTDVSSHFISFEQLLRGVGVVELNSVQLNVQVESLEGQVGLKNSIDAIRDYLLRAIEDVSKSGSEGTSLSWERAWLEKCTRKLNKITRMFDHVLRNLDFVQAKIRTWFNGGGADTARLTMIAHEVKGQGPVELLVSLPRERVLGFDYIVPFLLALTSSNEQGGRVGMTLFRLGCVQMLEFCNFQRFQQGLPLVVQCSSDDSSSEREGCSQHTHVRSVGRDVAREKLTAEELLSFSALQPRLSVVAGQSVASLSSGEPLLTVEVGVVGKPALASDTYPAEPRHVPTSSESHRHIDPLTSQCSLSAHSARNIRVEMSSSELRASVRVQPTLQFILDHFQDTDVLLECIGIVSSSRGLASASALEKKKMALGRYALFATRLLTLLHKYTSSPHLEVTTQLSLRVIANGRDVLICMENEVQDKAVFQLSATVNFIEILSDIMSLVKLKIGKSNE